MLQSLYSRESQGQSLKSSISSNPALLERLCKSNELFGHAGCVNAVSFNQSGSKLVTGSDDQQIKIWSHHPGKELITFFSGHVDNVFQAYMKADNESMIISCAADGKVRVSSLQTDGSVASSKVLGFHRQRAHKLALCPSDPNCFYSCGEDAKVFFYDLRTDSPQALLTCSKTGAQQGFPMGLYSIHCNPLKPEQFVIGGCDPSTRVYDHRFGMRGTGSKDFNYASCTPKIAPIRSLVPESVVKSRKGSHVTCAVFSKQGEILSSFGLGDIYRFKSDSARAQAIGNSENTKPERKRTRSDIVAETPGRNLTPKIDSVSPKRGQAANPDTILDSTSEEQPNENTAIAANIEDRALDSNGTEIPTKSDLRGDDQNSLHKKTEPRANASEIQSLEDHRNQEISLDSGDASFPYDSVNNNVPVSPQTSHERYFSDECMTSDSDEEGDYIPVRQVWDDSGEEEDGWGGIETETTNGDRSFLAGCSSNSDDEVLMQYTGHRNVATVKGVSFLGYNDEYVMSGSDCGHIFIWRTSDGKLVQVLKGDENVVNCLVQHPCEPLSFATSGIDESVKLWAPELAIPRSLSPELSRRLQARNSQAAFYSSSFHSIFPLLSLRRTIPDSDAPFVVMDDSDPDILLETELDYIEEEDSEESSEDLSDDEESDNDIIRERRQQQENDELDRRRRLVVAELRRALLEDTD